MNTQAQDEKQSVKTGELQSPQRTPLDEAEQERLDKLLSSARLFHYMNFVIAGISWAFCSLEKKPDVQLPLAGLSLPTLQASMAFYFVSIALTLASIILLRMAKPWIPLDPRRPPHAWFALGIRGKVSASALLWTIFPLFLAATAVTVILGKDVIGIGLLVPGILTAGLPFVVGNYLEDIRHKTDERGGPATFSIWLLYWYRTTRHVLLGLICVFSGLGAMPQWRNEMLTTLFWIGCFIFGLYVVRSICGFSWFYLKIDKWGTRFGFPQASQHYPLKGK